MKFSWSKFFEYGLYIGFTFSIIKIITFLITILALSFSHAMYFAITQGFATSGQVAEQLSFFHWGFLPAFIIFSGYGLLRIVLPRFIADLKLLFRKVSKKKGVKS